MPHSAPKNFFFYPFTKFLRHNTVCLFFFLVTYPQVAHERAERPFAQHQVEQRHGHDQYGHAQVGHGQRHEQVVARAPELADQAHGDAHEHVTDDGHHDDQEQHGADGERLQCRVRGRRGGRVPRRPRHLHRFVAVVRGRDVDAVHLSDIRVRRPAHYRRPPLRSRWWSPSASSSSSSASQHHRRIIISDAPNTICNISKTKRLKYYMLLQSLRGLGRLGFFFSFKHICEWFFFFWQSFSRV